MTIIHDMIIETGHLLLVRAIDRHGTMTQAGRELHLTQSALSHRLAALEGQLRTTLFHRLGRRMTLTPAGRRLLLAAERTLGELEAAEADLLRTSRGRTEVLRISTECYTTYHWLPRILRAFGASHPGIELRVVAEATADPVGALLAGAIDLAVMLSRRPGRHLRSLPLFEDELVVVTAPGHPMARRPFIELEALADEHLFVYSHLKTTDSTLGALFRAAGLEPRRVSVIQLTEAILELVAAGLGVAVMARWAITTHLANRSIAAVRLTRPGIHREWHAVTLRQTATTTAVKHLVALISRAEGPARRLPA